MTDSERGWNDRELTRGANRRLAVLRHADEVKNVAATCRYFGISRTAFFRWRHRYEDEGRRG